MARGTDCWHAARETRGFGALRAAEPPCFAVGVLACGSRSGRRAGRRLSGTAFERSVLPDGWSVSPKAREARTPRAQARA